MATLITLLIGFLMSLFFAQDINVHSTKPHEKLNNQKELVQQFKSCQQFLKS